MAGERVSRTGLAVPESGFFGKEFTVEDLGKLGRGVQAAYKGAEDVWEGVVEPVHRWATQKPPQETGGIGTGLEEMARSNLQQAAKAKLEAAVTPRLEDAATPKLESPMRLTEPSLFKGPVPPIQAPSQAPSLKMSEEIEAEMDLHDLGLRAEHETALGSGISATTPALRRDVALRGGMYGPGIKEPDFAAYPARPPWRLTGPGAALPPERMMTRAVAPTELPQIPKEMLLPQSAAAQRIMGRGPSTPTGVPVSPLQARASAAPVRAPARAPAQRPPAQRAAAPAAPSRTGSMTEDEFTAVVEFFKAGGRTHEDAVAMASAVELQQGVPPKPAFDHRVKQLLGRPDILMKQRWTMSDLGQLAEHAEMSDWPIIRRLAIKSMKEGTLMPSKSVFGVIDYNEVFDTLRGKIKGTPGVPGLKLDLELPGKMEKRREEAFGARERALKLQKKRLRSLKGHLNKRYRWTVDFAKIGERRAGVPSYVPDDNKIFIGGDIKNGLTKKAARVAKGMGGLSPIEFHARVNKGTARALGDKVAASLAAKFAPTGSVVGAKQEQLKQKQASLADRKRQASGAVALGKDEIKKIDKAMQAVARKGTDTETNKRTKYWWTEGKKEMERLRKEKTKAETWLRGWQVKDNALKGGGATAETKPKTVGDADRDTW